MVPLFDVAVRVGRKYPKLLDLQNQHKFEYNNARGIVLWDETNNDGPIVDFGWQALFSDELQHICTCLIEAESNQLNSALRGMSVSSRSEGAAKIQNIGEAF